MLGLELNLTLEMVVKTELKEWKNAVMDDSMMIQKVMVAVLLSCTVELGQEMKLMEVQ